MKKISLLLMLALFVFCTPARADKQTLSNTDCAQAFNNDTCVISNDYVNSCSGSAPAGKQCVVHDFHNSKEKCYCWENISSKSVQDCEEGDDSCIYMID
ncbi:MAG: hypothetical protein J5716_02230 [Alphaproteobacteria bacterium]|nr:hypothetical protein [Alphaproteobacteria bacterium]